MSQHGLGARGSSGCQGGLAWRVSSDGRSITFAMEADVPLPPSCVVSLRLPLAYAAERPDGAAEPMVQQAPLAPRMAHLLAWPLRMIPPTKQ